jgi:hypothetical protein
MHPARHARELAAGLVSLDARTVPELALGVLLVAIILASMVPAPVLVLGHCGLRLYCRVGSAALDLLFPSKETNP